MSNKQYLIYQYQQQEHNRQKFQEYEIFQDQLAEGQRLFENIIDQEKKQEQANDEKNITMKQYHRKKFKKKRRRNSRCTKNKKIRKQHKPSQIQVNTTVINYLMNRFKFIEQSLQHKLPKIKRGEICLKNQVKYQKFRGIRYFRNVIKPGKFINQFHKIMYEKHQKTNSTFACYPSSCWVIQNLQYIIMNKKEGETLLQNMSINQITFFYYKIYKLFSTVTKLPPFSLRSKKWFKQYFQTLTQLLQSLNQIPNKQIQQKNKYKHQSQLNRQHQLQRIKQQQISKQIEQLRQNYDAVEFVRVGKIISKREQELAKKFMMKEGMVEVSINISMNINDDNSIKNNQDDNNNKNEDNIKHEYIQQQKIDKIKKLKIVKPRCPISTCKGQLNDLKCSKFNHIIVICTKCNWNQHESLCIDNLLANNKNQYFQQISIKTKQHKMKYYKLLNLQKTQNINNIKQTVQKYGYQFISKPKIIPKTVKSFQCNYPILANNAANAILKNRQQQCWLPLTIKQSTIAEAGLGVFATQNIPKTGTLICSYLGEMGTGSVTTAQKQYNDHLKTTNNSIFTVGWLDRQIMIIAPNIYSNVGRFINYNKPQLCNLMPSLCLIQSSANNYEISVFLTSTKPIVAGEQLFYNYGSEYNNK